MDLKFAKERYDYELQRKEQLTSALALPVAALSILGGALISMGRSFSYRDEVLTPFFQIVLVADIIGFAVCLTCLGRAYHRQTYSYLPLLREIEDWETRHNRWAEEYNAWLDNVYSTGGSEIPGTEERSPVPSLLERIINAADRNTERNDTRSGLLYWARVWLFVVLFTTMLAGFPYVADQVRFRNAGTSKPATTDAPGASSTAGAASK
jgi:hypothetical protein